jgi:4-hydroxybenzoate polyprenyltransferase
MVQTLHSKKDPKKEKLRAYGMLFRLPSMFSSMSNIYAGYWIGGGFLYWNSLNNLGALSYEWGTLIFAMIAGGLMIFGGMGLNDVADAEVDAKERPTRPIPSGAVGKKEALAISVMLMILAGTIFISLNVQSVWSVLGVISSVFLYNFVLKSYVVGPVSMALCRMFNVWIGMSLGGSANPLEWTAFQWAAIGSMGMYITLVTYLARDEVQGNSGLRTNVFFIGLLLWFGTLCGLLGLQAHHFWKYGTSWYPMLGILLLGVYLWNMKDVYKNLWQESNGPNTGKCVGGMLVLLPVVDSINMILNEVFIPLALGNLLLILAAKKVAKSFYST